MYPLVLEIENFCRHYKSYISFEEFSSALVVGKIKDNDKFSNGVGKSTIFSAIKYVLFNEVDFSTLERIIRHGTDYCKVSLQFKSSFDNEIYKIIRFKHKKTGSEVRLFKKNNDIWDDCTQRRNYDTEKEISKLIKINYKTFCNSILFSQSDLSGLASMTPEKRKSLLKEILQLNVYSKYEELAKKRTKDLIKELEKDKIIIETIGDPSSDVSKFELDLFKINTDLGIFDKDLNLSKKEFDIESIRYNELYSNYEELNRQSSAVFEKQKTIQAEINKISSIISDYEIKISNIKSSIKNIFEEIDFLKSKLKNYTDLKHRDKNIIKKDIIDCTNSIINYKSINKSLISSLDELKIPLPDGNVCKHCRQVISDKDACQEEINKSILNIENKIQENQILLSSYGNKYKNLNDEIKIVENSETKISLFQSEISLKNQNIENKKSLYKEFSSIFDSAKLSLIEKNIEKKVLDAQILSNDNVLKIKSEISNIKNIIHKLSFKLEEINKNKIYLSNNKAVLLHKIDERKKDNIKYEKCIKNISYLESQYIIHQKVLQAFGSNGIPALITYTILDDLQVETNYWLSRLFQGLQLSFLVVKERDDGNKEDTLNINYTLDGYDMEYLQLSGAQKFIVAFSLKLGLASIIKKRLGVEINLLLIDEVDQSLDEGNVDIFENIIHQLQKDFKILVITHNNELKSKFNNIILVEQDENFVSTAKVVNL